MTPEESPDETQADYVTAMGSELGPVYAELKNELVWLHAVWVTYRQLFAESEKRLALLNETADVFFRILSDTLWRDVVLQVARLTDPPESLGRKNLSLQRLPGLVSGELEAKTTELLQVALDAAEFARAWRNRRLAHRDLETALATSGDPLPGISRADVETALKAFREVMNHLERHYGDTTVYYEMPLLGADANSLVSYLNWGRFCLQERSERVRAGEWNLPEPEEV